MKEKLQQGYGSFLGLTMLLAIGVMLVLAPQGFAGDEIGTVSVASSLSNAVNSGADRPGLFTGSNLSDIPVDVPAGRHGMQPNLSMHYDSMGSNSWLGQKWGLEVGAIERDRRPVDFSADKYVYRSTGGAQELVALGGGEYRAKIEGAFLSFQKSATGWLMRDKSGRKYYFGQTVASRQDDPNDASKIFKWCLDRVEDTNGNYMTVLYDKDYVSGNNQLYLQQIDYAGNSTLLAPTNQVTFYTEPRPDVKVDFSAGFKVVTAKRLRTIKSQGNNNNFAAYNFIYQYSTVSGASQLTEVKRYGNDANVNSSGLVSGGLAPQVWKVGYPYESVALSDVVDGPKFIIASYSPPDAEGTVRTKFGDFNGDGRIDIIKFNVSTGALLYFSNGTGFDAPISSTLSWTASLMPYVSGKLLDTVKVADFNGDGKADLLYQPYDGINIYPLRIYYSNGNGFNDYNNGPTTLSSPSGDIFLNVSRVKVADFNGDGKCDILKIKGYGTTVASDIYYATATGFSSATAGPSLYVGGDATTARIDLARIRIADFNGDGMNDILRINGLNATNPSALYLSKGTGFMAKVDGPAFTVGNSANAPVDLARVLASDFNGDGLCDLFRINGYGGGATPSSIYYANGAGSFSLPFDGPLLSIGGTFDDASLDLARIKLADFTGDGRVDLLRVNGYGTTEPSTVYSATAGAGWVDESTAWQESIGPSYSVSTSTDFTSHPEMPVVDVNRVVAADFTGSGRDSLLWIAPPGTTSLLNSTSGLNFNLMTSLTEPLGGVTTFEYKSSAEFDNSGGLPLALNVVSAVTQDDGNGNSSRSEFDYTGGYYHVGEHDFRGFNKVTVTGPSGANGEQQISETWFHQGDDTVVDTNDPAATEGFMKGKPYRVRTMDKDRNIISEVSTTYKAPPVPNTPPYFNPLDQVVTSVCDGDACGISTKTTFEYDQYGNVTDERLFPTSTTTAEYRRIVRDYFYNSGAWLVALPKSETVFAFNQTTQSYETQAKSVMFYDDTYDCSTLTPNEGGPTEGNLSRILRYSGATTWVENWFGYDDTGNQVCKGYVASVGESGISCSDPSYIYDSSRNQCEKPPVCPGGYTYDSASGQCSTAVTSCTATASTTTFSGTISLGTYESLQGVGNTIKGMRGTNLIGTITATSATTYSGLIELGGFKLQGVGNTIKGTGDLGNPTGTITATSAPTYSGLIGLGIYKLQGVGNTIKGTGDLGNPFGTITATSGTTYSCPITGGSACTGTPSTCVALAAPTCPGGTMDQTNNVCFAAYVPNCPTGYTYNSVYDPATLTYPVTNTDPNGNVVSSEYYGVNGVIADKGLVGQVKRVTDPNNAQFTREYDPFGRIVKEYDAETANYTYGTASYVYQDIGVVGQQQVIKYVSDQPTMSVTCAVGTPDGDRCYVPSSCPPEAPNFEGDGCYDEDWNQYVPLCPQNTTLSPDMAECLGAQPPQPFLNYTAHWEESYFDGFGRVFKTRSEGGGNHVITSTLQYDSRGAVVNRSLPYYEGEEPKNTAMIYDTVGRVTSVTTPDGFSELACYNDQYLVKIDKNGHRTRETRDEFGRLISIQEYTGIFADCTTDADTPYATTSYGYDAMNNLIKVINAKGNQTTIVNDWLGRKTNMTDPDMGSWTYEYDANSNLWKQTDAKQNTIIFNYDNLNRLVGKDYPTGADVSYTYDETAKGFAKGRLTTMTDASGTTAYYYDNRYGRQAHLVKTVDGVNYTISSTTDVLGRPASITYPDGEVVDYAYDAAGNLGTIGSYVTYMGFNALGQPATKASMGENWVFDSYEYDANTAQLFRLKSILETTPATPLLDLQYEYDNNGNVRKITDYRDSTRTQDFVYDGLDRLTSAQSGKYGVLGYSYDQLGNFQSKEGVIHTLSDSMPHAVSSTSDGGVYGYDDNGNMTSDGSRLLVWDYDNRPTSITLGGATTSFVYDGDGNRVKKVGPAGTTVYLGNLYECSGGVCAKYIVANGVRLALKTGEQTYFYHQDHLGSTRLVTDALGNKVEELFYKPFGEAAQDTGGLSLNHKYTGQELDSETGLYFYNARYYNPRLGKFVSADTIVPAPSNPQSLNRYSYVLNNPLIYTDPTGNFSLGITHWVQKRLGEIGDTLDKVFDKLGVSVEGASVGAEVNSGGDVSVVGGNPTTGETYGSSNHPAPRPNPYDYSGTGSVSGGSTYAGRSLTLYLYIDYPGGLTTPVGDSTGGPGGGSSGNNTSSTSSAIPWWVSPALNTGSAISSYVSLFPSPQTKFIGKAAGLVFTSGSLMVSSYKWSNGEISDGRFALEVSLAVAPGLGSHIAEKFGASAVSVLINVGEHQLGVIPAVIEFTNGLK